MPPLDIPYNCLLTGYMDARAGVHSRYALFDKLVPGYYHRRSEQGDLCTSACCNNTAPEHAMCERLIVEDCLHWARQYKACQLCGGICMTPRCLGHLERNAPACLQRTPGPAAAPRKHGRLDGDSPVDCQ